MNTHRFYGKRAVTTVLPVIESEDDLVNTDDDEEDLCNSDDDENTNPRRSGSSDELYDDSYDTEPEIDEPNQIGALQTAHNSTKPKPIQWRTARGTTATPQWTGSLPVPLTTKDPTEYVKQFLTDELLDYITDQSNLYSVQVNPNKSLQLSRNELSNFIGMVMAMSVYGLPATRMYWGGETRIPRIADVMPCKRFEEIKRYLHFNNNADLDPDTPDKLFKIRPFYESIVGVFRTLPMGEHLSIDEQIVPFKGRSSLKQYNPMKPKKWGYKIFVLSDSQGLVHDMSIYDGHLLPVHGKTDIGGSGNIVLQLAETIPKHKGHKIIYDNWFTGLNLQVELEKVGIHSIGTVRKKRLKGCTLISDQDLKKRGRGHYEEKSTIINDVELRAIKWYDNRAVTLLTSYSSAEPVGEVKRFDRKTKDTVDVACPHVIQLYNAGMGGVDSLDSYIALYRTKIRSRKWYMRLAFQMFDVIVVQGWLLFKRDASDLGMADKDIPLLREFKLSVSKVLLG